MAATTITCADGFELGAYEANPSNAAKGAVVVIQEIFGVNSHIRSVVDGYAAEGFYAIAPAIFDRLERSLGRGQAGSGDQCCQQTLSVHVQCSVSRYSLDGPMT